MKDQIKKNALNMKDKIENRIKHEMLKWKFKNVNGQNKNNILF